MAEAETLARLLTAATAGLAQAGVATPRLDAETLLAAAMGLSRLQMLLVADRVIGADVQATFDGMLVRRMRHQPISQILGHREFWSLDFKVTPDTLTPRPDSETLVAAALQRLDRKGVSRQAPLRLLDLGTGSGCLLLSLLHELPNAWGLGVDRSLAAARVAATNARRLDLADRAAFLVGDWADAVHISGPAKPFDLVISNPPYIPASAIPGLDADVRDHEPHLALNGGEDGLDPYQMLAKEFPRLLGNGDGGVMVEIGAGQERDVSQILAQTLKGETILHKDLGGHVRCVEMGYREKNNV